MPRTMHRLLAVTLVVPAISGACAVPDVVFDTAEAGTPESSTGDASPGLGDASGSSDATERSNADDGSARPSDAGGEGDPEDAPQDAPEDAGYDGPFYCSGPGSKMPPMGGKCCPMNGGPCYGDCNAMGCAACGPCTSPRVCCTSGVMGTCQMPPCPG